MNALPRYAIAILFSVSAANAQEPNPPVPDWVHGVTRMAFVTPGQVDEAAKLGVQVLHGNAVWPYYPLRKDGGGLNDKDAKLLRDFADSTHRRGMKLVLGLPPFPPVNLVEKHPDWRVHADDSDKTLKIVPREDNLGTRLGCNVGPWGEYLIAVCRELVEDYGVDGYSFDGNYHPSICYCPHCKKAYRGERQRDLPAKANLDDVAYREYLVWRGGKLKEHYRKLKSTLRQASKDAVIMSWTVNAGRYGHFLHSPRAMPTSMNRVFDLPMQEWWLDETNFGASVAPAFGAAYIAATVGYGPNASEPYLMSRGNPYGSDSFPAHERLTRTLLAMTNGSQAPQSLGWPGQQASNKMVFDAIAARQRYTTRTKPLPWAALLVSEQTRQFYAYRDIADRFLAHQFGVFRCAMEEHLPLTLINDWDIGDESLSRQKMLVLANAAALSNAQVAAIRRFVQGGGGLVATAESSLFDELGRPRDDFALKDLFGVSFQGRPKAPTKRPDIDANFAITVDENYWKQRVGIARLRWDNHELLKAPKLGQLVPGRSAVFRGAQVAVSEPKDARDVVIRMQPDGAERALPGMIVRPFGKGRVVYLAAGLDHALYSYGYPYQRVLLAQALRWAAREPLPVEVTAPMCVQTTFFEQDDNGRKRLVVHLFNGLSTTSGHGAPAVETPLREETVPVAGIRVRFTKDRPGKLRLEPGGHEVKLSRDGEAILPPLELHAMLIGE
jgi:hypothetical protein